MRCCVLLLLFPYLTHQSYFKKLFADAGVAIHCPSDNRVYIHPISGDLQQCSQQLGNYNESSCPEGTVCERFPILIPGFQDYCCWSDSQTTDTENLILGTTTEIPDELIPFTEYPVIQPMRKLVVTAAPERPDDEDNGGEDEDYEEPTTKRPRNRKTTTTTTTEEPTTTTKKPSNRRLPRCQNQDDRPLIDFGNRLRDCYHQQCNRGYRCEFNKEIRRFICCGQTTDSMPPPAGLPYIPQPKPLIPRPYRPRPFGILNDGDEDEEGNGCPQNKQSGCKNIHPGSNQNHNSNNMNNGNTNGNENGYNRGNENASGHGNMNGSPNNNNYQSVNQNGNQNNNQNMNQNGSNNNNNHQNNNYNNWNENGCPYNQNRQTTTPGCPYGPTNRPPPQGINDGCSGNAMQGCGMKGGWNQNGKNSGNNVEQQQLPPPRALPEPQPIHPTGNSGNGMNGPQENRVGNGNWGDYDNPFDSNQGNSAYNRGNGGYENSQVPRPRPQSKGISGSNSGQWSGPANGGNWNNGNGGNNWAESSSVPNWQGPPPNDQNGWNNGAPTQQGGGNWNGPPPIPENIPVPNKNRWIAVPSGNGNPQPPDNSANGWTGGKGNNWENQGDWGPPQPNFGNAAVNMGKGKRPNMVPVAISSSTNGPAPMSPNKMGPRNGMGNDYNDYGDGTQDNKNWGSGAGGPAGHSTGQPRPFNSWNTGSTGSNKRRSSNTEQCPAGNEFREQGNAPKCFPPGSDSCPLSHPRCIPSSSLDHNVCCL